MSSNTTAIVNEEENNITTGILFQNFIKVYEEVYPPAENGYTNIYSHIADEVLTTSTTNYNWFLQIDDNPDLLSAWEQTGLGLQGYDYTNSCQAFYDAQMRLWYIWQNVNFQVWKSAGASKNNHQMFMTAFKLMSYLDISSSFDVTGYVTNGFIESAQMYFPKYSTENNIVTQEDQLYMTSTYYNSAANIRSQVMIQYMGVADATNGGYVVPWGNIQQGYRDLPNYQELFDQQNFIQVDDDLSVLSPSAYLVDLDKNARRYITPESTDDNEKTIDHRRPDLKELELTPAKTNNEIAKLDIVNTVLSAQIEKRESWENQDELIEALNTRSYPLEAPFNQYIEPLRTALSLQQTSLATIWQTVNPSSVVTTTNDYQLAINLEKLGLYKKLYDDVLGDPAEEDIDKMRIRYGFGSGTALLSIQEILASTLIENTDLANILYGNLSNDEIDDTGLTNPMLEFYVNGWYKDMSQSPIVLPMKIIYEGGDQEIENRTTNRLDRMNRFIRLANETGIDYSDLNWIITIFEKTFPAADQDALQTNELYKYLAFIQKILTDFNSGNTLVATAIVGLVKDFGSQSGSTMIQNIFGDYAPGYNNTNVKSWDLPNSEESLNDATAALMKGTGLSQGDFTLLSVYCATQFGYEETGFENIALDQDFLSALYRVSIAARLLGVNIQSMIYLMDNLDDSYKQYAGPLLSAADGQDGYTTADQGVITLVNAIQGIQNFVALLSDTEISTADMLFMGNNEYQDASLVPGLNETIDIIKQVNSSLSETSLLTEAAFNDWLNSFTDAVEPGENDEDLYDILVKEGFIDQEIVSIEKEDVETTTIIGGVVLKTDASDLDIPEWIDWITNDVLNEMLGFYQDQQNEIINGVLKNTLNVSDNSGVSNTITDWKTLLFTDDKGSVLQIGNALHLFYTFVQKTLLVDNTTVNELTADQLDNQIYYLQTMARFAALVNDLSLSEPEVRFIINGYVPALQPANGEGTFLINPIALEEVMQLHNLVVSYADTDNNLLKFLEAKSNYSNYSSELSKATSWTVSDINYILSYWSANFSDNGTIALVVAMETLFQLSAQTNVSVETLVAFTNSVGKVEVDTFKDEATQMQNVVYAANPDTDETSIEDTLDISSDEDRRDVLATWLLQIFRNSGDEYLQKIITFSDLSQYLLFDIEVTGKVKTSEIREAISAYTTYFYRVIANMESGLTIDKEFANNQWLWSKSYRIWEANRKVFLNPENYLEPDLRKGMSDVFSNFSKLVTQSSSTEDNMEDAFFEYLQEFQSVANLACIASFLLNNNNELSISFVGQTHVEPLEYYTRKLKLDDTNGNYVPQAWTSWHKVTAAIPSPFVHVISAFGTLYLFWLEFQMDGSDGNTTKYQAQIKYTFQQINGEWSPIQNGGTAQLTDGADYDEYLYKQDYNNLALSIITDELGRNEIYIKYYDASGTIIAIYSVDQWSVLTDHLLTDIAVNDGSWSKPAIIMDGDNENTNQVYTVTLNNKNVQLQPDYSISDFHSSGPSERVFPAENSYLFDDSMKVNNLPVAPLMDMKKAGFSLSYYSGVTVSMWIYTDALEEDDEIVLWRDPSNIMVATMSPGKIKLQFNQNGTHNYTINHEKIVANQWIYLCCCIKATDSQDFGYVHNTMYVGINNAGYMQTLGNKESQYSNFHYDEPQFVMPSQILLFPISDNRTYYLQFVQAVNQYFNTSSVLANIEPLSGYDFYQPIEPPFDNLPDTTTSQWVSGSGNQMYVMNTGVAEYLAINFFEENNQNSLWRYIRLTSGKAAMNFVDQLRDGGVESLLSVNTQLTSEDSFSEMLPQVQYIPKVYWPNDDYIDINGANALYYQELFAFAPWLVARTYQNSGDYSNAQEWYKYIFDVSIRYDEVSKTEKEFLKKDENATDIYWRYIGFRTYFDSLLAREIFAQPQGRLLEEEADKELTWSLGSSGSTFNNTARNQALAEYYNDPFNPHAIAQLRPIAYQKAMVMSYIRALIDWGDRLYVQATVDSILEATILYQEASDLLGVKPTQSGSFSEDNENSGGNTRARTLEGIDNLYEKDEHAIPEFLVGLESSLDNIVGIPTQGQVLQEPFNFIPGMYFGIPENQQMLSFWNIVESRLFNIRNSLDINGNPLNLALFEPAINVMTLVSAAAGGSLSDALGSVLNTQAPIYRYAILLSKAKEFCGAVTSFGQSLLATLEKQDAQELAQLELGQQSVILNMTLEMKQAQISQLETQLSGLVQSMMSATTRLLYYGQLIENSTGNLTSILTSDPSASNLLDSAMDGSASLTETFSDGTEVEATFDFTDTKKAAAFENEAIRLTMLSLGAQVLGGVYSLGASVAYAFPTIYGTSNGGFNPGAVLGSIGGNFQTLAGIFGTSSGLSGTQAGYRRRDQDWELQKQLAEIEVEQIKLQYEGLQYQYASAQQDYQITQTQITQNQVVLNFYKSKFSNEELYKWMAGQLTGTYYQAYKLALTLSKEAQEALMYDLGLHQNDPGVNLINTSGWDDNYAGLMAGETLSHSLNLLDHYYLEHNVRKLEVVKTISLLEFLRGKEEIGENQTFANWLETQTVPGTFTFDVEEDDLNEYPGAYRMQIKMLSVTVPTLLGPYQDFVATLQQTYNAIKVNRDDITTEYRENWGKGQKIALSTGQEDAGMFSPNFDDARYLPFECTGAISNWQMIINSAEVELSNISDIIIRIRYTALQ